MPLVHKSYFEHSESQGGKTTYDKCCTVPVCEPLLVVSHSKISWNEPHAFTLPAMIHGVGGRFKPSGQTQFKFEYVNINYRKQTLKRKCVYNISKFSSMNRGRFGVLSLQ
jgi:hypothetical protein